MKISREVIIGIVALVTILTSIWGYKFLKGDNFFTSDNEYYVQYTRVDQLSNSAPVLVNGFQVGSVMDIYIDDDPNNTIIVHFTVKGSIKVPKTAKANIVSTSIMGGKAIELDLNGRCTGEECAESGSFLEGDIKGLLESMLDAEDIDKYMESASEGVQQFVDTLDKTLKESEAREGIGKSMKDLQATINNLKTSTSEINTLVSNLNSSLPTLINNLNSIAHNINQQDETINKTLNNLQQVTSDLKEAQIGQLVTNANDVIQNSSTTIASLEKTSNNLNNLISDINSGKGSLGKLINTEDFYNNLQRSTRNLDLLLQDIRLNPKRYINVSVFGGKDKEYHIPEEDPAYPKKDSSKVN